MKFLIKVSVLILTVSLITGCEMTGSGAISDELVYSVVKN